MTYTASEPISADVIADALVKLGEKEGGEKVLVVAPAQLAQLRKSEGWLKATDVGAMRLVSGAVGMIHGCQVIVSDKITASGGNFTNYIVMPGALVLFLKKDTEVESQRDIVHKSTVVTADKYYASIWRTSRRRSSWSARRRRRLLRPVPAAVRATDEEGL